MYSRCLPLCPKKGETLPKNYNMLGQLDRKKERQESREKHEYRRKKSNRMKEFGIYKYVCTHIECEYRLYFEI